MVWRIIMKKGLKLIIFIFLYLGLSCSVIADLNDSLVAYYPFNNNANDDTQHANNGAVNGAILGMDRHGNENSAYVFNGQNNYISISHDSSLNMTNKMTVSAWVKSNDMGKENQDILSKTESGSYSLALNETDGEVDSKFAFLVNINNNYEYVYSASHPQEEWYHVVGSYDGSEMKIYVNGIVEGTLSVSGSVKNNTSPLILGNESHQLNEPFDGTLDEIRIYNRLLLSSEVLALYQESNWSPDQQTIEYCRSHLKECNITPQTVIIPF
jgi:hypothetical protein